MNNLRVKIRKNFEIRIIETSFILLLLCVVAKIFSAVKKRGIPFCGVMKRAWQDLAHRWMIISEIHMLPLKNK